MKNTKTTHNTFRMDLAVMILFLLLFHRSIVSAQSSLTKGEEMFEAGNYYGAGRFFNQVLENDDKDAAAHYFLGRIAFEKEYAEEATDHFERATELDPQNSKYFTWKGINYLRMLSQVDFMKQAIYAPKALSSLERAVELDGRNLDARIYLAGYYANAPSFAGGSPDKAEEQFDSIFSIDPDHKGGLLQYGVFKMGAKEYQEARNCFEKLMIIDSGFYPAYLQMGRLSAKSQLYQEQGALSLIKFIDLAPEEFSNSKDEAWWYLGRIYATQGNIERAQKAYKKAVSLDPENEEYQRSLKNIL